MSLHEGQASPAYTELSCLLPESLVNGIMGDPQDSKLTSLLAVQPDEHIRFPIDERDAHGQRYGLVIGAGQAATREFYINVSRPNALSKSWAAFRRRPAIALLSFTVEHLGRQ